MKLHPTQIRNIKKNFGIILFITILIASFIALNAASGLLFSTHKLDLTKDQRYTLHPQTVSILQNMTKPITINIYYSSSISKDYPLYSQYAQLVLRTLDKYKNVSQNKIKINILDPIPYSSTEEDALRHGLHKFSSKEGEAGYYFGAIMTNTEGKKYTIPYFQSQRQDYLENDLTRAISSLSNFNRRNIGIMSPDIPLIDTSYRGKKANKDWTFIKLLRQDYNIVEISPTISEIPLEIETIILFTTNKLPANTAYVIDQFVMRGGKLMVMVDPHSIYEDKMKGITSPVGSDINILLEKWGIRYNENKVIGDKQLAQDITLTNGNVQKFFPIFTLKAENMSSTSLITQNLQNILLQTPGGLELVETPDVQTIPLLETSSKTTIIDAQISKFGSKEDVINSSTATDKTFILAALSTGTYQSAFKRSPFSAEITTEQLPYISGSIIPSKIIVISDADWIHQQSWIEPAFINGNTTNEVVYYNNNFDFLLRSIDYLTSNEKNMAVGPKLVADRNDTLGKRIEQITSSQYSSQYQELQKDFEESKAKLNSILLMIKNQEIATSIKNLSEVNEMQRSLQKKQELMRRMEHKIKENSKNMIDIIVTTNTLVLPIIVIGFIILVVFLLRRHNKNKAQRIIK